MVSPSRFSSSDLDGENHRRPFSGTVPGMTERVDLAIIGGGILGLATALRLTESRPDLRVAVLEKESGLATHQSGHNSGVVHAGLYYAPGSLKARLCRQGVGLLKGYCQERGIAYEE